MSKFNPMKVSELIGCLRAGWKCRWLTNALAQRRPNSGDAITDEILAGERCVWLDRFCADDHPDLCIESAIDDARDDGLVWEREVNCGIREILLTNKGQSFGLERAA